MFHMINKILQKWFQTINLVSCFSYFHCTSFLVYSNILASLPIGATNLKVESEYLGSFGLSAHAKGFFSCSYFVQNQAINTTGFEDEVTFFF